jgi:hypothetical protein
MLWKDTNVYTKILNLTEYAVMVLLSGGNVFGKVAYKTNS